MRRVLGMLVVATLLLPALAALAGTENLRDDFGDISYSGNDGSLHFAAPWSEVGEGDGPSSGQVRVTDDNCSNNNCLQLWGGLLLSEVGASRPADLSGFSSAQLAFDMHLQPAPLLSSATLRVEARGNGRNWTTLESYGLSSGESSEEFDVSAYAGADFQLRFRLTGLVGGDRVAIDRVNIEGSVATTTTSSTSSTTSSSTSSTTSTTSLITLPSISIPLPVESSTTTTTEARATTTTTGQGTDEDEGTGSTSTSSTSTTVSASTGTSDGSPTTTTTVAGSSTTTPGASGLAAPPPPPISGDGLRDPGIGLMADYRRGMMGDIEEVEILGVDLEADFSIAAELFEVARMWIAILALLLTAALVSGMDWKRSRPGPAD